MAKLTKREARLHERALGLVRAGRPLTLDEREFVLDHFHEGARHASSLAGAFFTPRGLARDVQIEVPGNARVLDLCAGAGRLAAEIVKARRWARSDDDQPEVVCVELNPDYVEAGRAAVPEATWVRGDALDLSLLRSLGPFDVVVSNPPFGRVAFDRPPPPEGEPPYAWVGSRFELALLEVAARVARYGVFVLPQEACPFRYSGERSFRKEESRNARRFREATGIVLEPSCGIDCSVYRDAWRFTAPKVEIALADFEESAAERAS